MSWTRRATLGALGAGLVTQALGAGADPQLGPGAEFGWATADERGQPGLSLNAHRRFPMCSSFKWLLAAFVLWRVDSDLEHLDRRVPFEPRDILDYAPACKAVLAEAGGQQGEMSVDALCEAAVTLSDNTAANLLLRAIGGPGALTTWLRGRGDAVTRLDRSEPTLNYVALNDTRDTTTPAAMIGEVHRILFGAVLTRVSRERLMRWLLDCKTGETRLKAGLPAGWRIAQKTGTLDYHPGLPTIRSGASGDVGVLFPPTGKAILVAAYTSGSRRPQAEVDAWFASLGRTIAARAV